MKLGLLGTAIQNPNHKRTKSVNPNAKVKANLIQTPKRKPKFKTPLGKSNVNKSTSYNKKIENSVIEGHEFANKHNQTFVQTNQRKTLEYDYDNNNNTIKTRKIRNEVKNLSLEKKICREPRNPSLNKNKILSINQQRKESSNEKKGKFLV